MAQVWVLGSINADRTVAVAKLPQPGETVLAGAIGEASGGKGANQAVAAAKLGAATALIGRVGEDAIGEILLQDLQTSGVDVSRVAIDSLAPTGQAWIAVDGLGQNQIIVLPGANQAVGGAEVDRLQRSLGSAPRPIALLLQLEVPLAAVVAAAQAGQAAGAIVLLDPAPAPEHLPPELWAAINWITPNATEAAQLVGFPVQTPEDAARAATRLQELGAKGAIVTLGEQGAWVAGPTDCFGNRPSRSGRSTLWRRVMGLMEHWQRRWWRDNPSRWPCDEQRRRAHSQPPDRGPNLPCPTLES